MDLRRTMMILAASSLLLAAAPAWSAGQTQPAETAARPAAQTVDPTDPVLTFEHAWKTLDRNYAQFGVKHVDWAALYRVYRPQVTPATTEKELWETLLAMLGHLNDEHVCLADSSRRVCAGQSEGRKADDFSLDLVKSTYLHGKFTEALGGSFVSGWLAEGIGYLYIGDFKDGLDPIVTTIDSVIAELAGARAVVVDVRNNPGGTGRAVEIVANRFADRRRHFMSAQIRYGPKHDNFLPVDYRNMEPGGPLRFTRPTVLLANRASASAADSFVLAMRVLPHVTVVGDVTEGAFSAQFPEKLPNGWTLWVAFKVVRDHNGVCWDGVGVPPDLRIVNTPADTAAGRDRVLEFAAEFLEKGAPAPQDEQAGLTNLKTSLVEAYTRDVTGKGLEAAIAGLEQGRKAQDATHFFSPDEAMQQAQQYLGRKQYSEAIGLLRACRESVPELAATYAMLAQAHLGRNEVEAAEAILKQGETVEPMFPWEQPQIARAKTALRKAKLGSAADLLAKALAAGGIPAADQMLEDLLKRGEGGPVFDESDFNALGYKLLQENQLESAVYVFEKNVELYPGSWNAWDSLGEAAAKAGRKERAIEGFRKSLELNPRNKNAQAMLAQLEKEQ